MRIRDDPSVGWYMGRGTQAFHLLTVAAAALWTTPLERVEDGFTPKNAKDPAKHNDH
jgi:hypothetical protein